MITVFSHATSQCFPGHSCLFFFFFTDFILFIFRESWREGEKEGEKHETAASPTPPPRNPANNPGSFPDWASNRWPFGSQAGTQSAEPHHPGLLFVYFSIKLKLRLQATLPHPVGIFTDTGLYWLLLEVQSSVQEQVYIHFLLFKFSLASLSNS